MTEGSGISTHRNPNGPQPDRDLRELHARRTYSLASPQGSDTSDYFATPGNVRGAGEILPRGFSGLAGVRDGSAVVGATSVAVTAGDWVWTAAAAGPSHVFTPRCALQASVRFAALEKVPSLHSAVLPAGAFAVVWANPGPLPSTMHTMRGRNRFIAAPKK